MEKYNSRLEIVLNDQKSVRDLSETDSMGTGMHVVLLEDWSFLCTDDNYQLKMQELVLS